jgi:hypothetical protein
MATIFLAFAPSDRSNGQQFVVLVGSRPVLDRQYDDAPFPALAPAANPPVIFRITENSEQG